MTLAQDLARQEALSRARRPDEFWAAVDAKAAELARAGLAQSCLQAGDRMPAFALPGAVGQTVSSDARLTDGPLVVRHGHVDIDFTKRQEPEEIVGNLERLGAT